MRLRIKKFAASISLIINLLFALFLGFFWLRVPDFVYYFKEPSDWHWHSNCPRELCYCRELDLRQIQTVKGFALVSDAYSPYEIQGWNRGIVFPYWPIVILTIAPLTPWLLRLSRKWMQFKAKGQFACQHCGYDLRATPARCPECGKTATIAAGEEIPMGQKPPSQTNVDKQG